MAGTPLDFLPNAGKLFERISAPGFSPVESNMLILVSLEGLPGTEDSKYWDEFSRVLMGFKQRFNAHIFRISQIEYGILAKVSELNLVNTNTTLKFDLLKLIQQHFPEFFGMVDQSRLIRNIDLRLRRKNAISYLEYRTQEAETHNSHARKTRALREPDIARVHQVLEHVGPESFSKLFVRQQPIVVIKEGMDLTVAMHEYYVAMDDLRKNAFPEVELRGSGNLFNQLTIELDRILMSLFGSITAPETKASINLNVESVFTPAFENFLSSRGETGLANLVFEFRQPDILQHFEEFQVAASMIYERSGNIAVDAIFPETIGIVNINRIGASMAKIYWQQGAETSLPELASEIEAMQRRGLMVIMSRVDEDVAIETGRKLGINMFQGFYVDKMLKHHEEKKVIYPGSVSVG